MNNTETEKKQFSIEVNGVSKNYKIFGRKRDWLKQMLWGKRKKYFKDVKALDNVDMNIEKGKVYGIVGKNGSGKSTLLQIICGTTSASKGSVRARGKIAALLELGSGFDPDFSGRENIYLNAMLMGLTKQQVEEKIEKIIAFADIGDYIDEPIRTYSSGMVVRVAFAVIANVEADILIIDEALAVGDVYFTQKCMRFIQRFKENGTILFVSHDTNTVISLCDTAILLDKGNKVYEGAPKDVMERYTRNLKCKSDEELNEGNARNREKENNDRASQRTILNRESKYDEEWFKSHIKKKKENYKIVDTLKYGEDVSKVESFGGKKAKIIEVKIKNLNQTEQGGAVIEGGELVHLIIKVKAIEQIERVIIGFLLKNDKGIVLLGDNTGDTNENKEYIASNGTMITAEFIFTMPLLPKGEYSITSSVARGTLESHNILHWVNDSLILVSHCTSIAAGLAGVAMHSIKLTSTK